MDWLEILSYILPTLLALAVIYFFAGFAIFKNAHAYQEIDEGKEMALKALSIMFVVVIVWLIFRSITLFL